MPTKLPNLTFGLNWPVTPAVAVRIVYLSPTMMLLPLAMLTMAPLLSVAGRIEAFSLLAVAPLMVIR